MFGFLLVASSLHTNLFVAPGSETAVNTVSSSGPTHTSHPMVPVPPQPVSPEVATSSSNSLCPLSSSDCLFSYNWGGYSVCQPQASCADLTSSPGTVTEVQGSWIVPAITSSSGGGFSSGNYGTSAGSCSDSEKTWYDDSDWVGIDGLVSQTVEQTGTSSDCYYGQAYYYAWYEFYPAASLLITSINVQPGDVMTAQVNCVPGATAATCTTTITDERTHQSYTSPAIAVPGAETDSAEWISESAYYEGFLALTQTSPVQFSDASATIGGVTHTISGWVNDPTVQVFWLVMVDYNFGINQETGVSTPSTETLAYAKAGTSALSRNGAGFSVDWLSAGP